MGGAGADGYERSEGAAVIKMIYIILTLVSGILLSGVWFGLNFLIQICVEKSKVKFLERYSVIAASVIPLVFILKYNRLELWNYIRFVLSIPVTAFVWCISICIQCLICKLKFDWKIVIEIAASFLFSMGAGLLLLKSGFIGLPMAGHFLERILSTIIRKIRR